MHYWNKLITIQRHSTEEHTLHIQPTSVIMAKLPNGDKPDIKTSLRTSLDSLRDILLLPASSELRKLPKDTTPLLTTLHPFMATIQQARQPIPLYDKLLRHSSESFRHQQPTRKHPTIHIPKTLPTPDATKSAPLAIVDINNHKIFIHQTIYHVNQ